MSYDSNNLFAKLLRGEIPCQKVKESPHSLAFHDIQPQSPHHILIIPKGAYENFSDFSQNATAAEKSDFFRLIDDIVTELHLQQSGYRLITNMGKDAQQTVAHFHFHLMGGRFLGGLLPPPE